jgi:diguanylate cyclase (GGDEF)-like protein/PAS domain S-box-containing protein
MPNPCGVDPVNARQPDDTLRASGFFDAIIPRDDDRSTPPDRAPGQDLTAFLSTVSEGSLVTDTDYRIRFANAGFTAVTGYSEEEVLGRNCNFLQGEGTDRKTVAAIRIALDAGLPFRGHILNYRKNGEPFWNFLTITALKDSSDVVSHFVSVQVDVTDLMTVHGLTEDLLEKERTLRETATSLLGAARALNEVSGVDAVSSAVVGLAAGLCASDHAALALWDESNQRFVVTGQDESRIERTELEAVLRSEAPTIVRDDESPLLRQLMPDSGSTVGLVAPVARRGEVIGLIAVGWSDDPGGLLAHSERLGELAGLAASALANANAFDESRWKARHDPLTGLLNRGGLADSLVGALEQAHVDGTTVAVLYCDIDQFKLMNDSRGHLEGDSVLVAVAATLQRAVRHADIVARVGGDEFVIVLPDVVDAADADIVIRRIRAGLPAPVQLVEGYVPVELSIGIAFSDAQPLGATPADTADELLRLADASMYAEKAAKGTA